MPVTETQNVVAIVLLDVTAIPVLPLHVKHAMLDFGPLLVQLCVLRVIRAKKVRDHQLRPTALPLAQATNTLLPVLPPAPSVPRARKHKAVPPRMAIRHQTVVAIAEQVTTEMLVRPPAKTAKPDATAMMRLQERVSSARLVILTRIKQRPRAIVLETCV